jgi:NADH dehydrogenase FAD-containing subunit
MNIRITEMSHKTILVVGYGIAGSTLTANLVKSNGSAKNKIIVVTPQDYQEVPFRMTMACAAGSDAHKRAIYDCVREDGVEYRIAAVTELTNEAATLSDGTIVNFDVCIVCTGMKFPMFKPSLSDTTSTMRQASVAADFEKIRNANSIVISGGGPVGVEFASDVKMRYPNKK